VINIPSVTSLVEITLSGRLKIRAAGNSTWVDAVGLFVLFMGI
jgi:hypothetical protein